MAFVVGYPYMVCFDILVAVLDRTFLKMRDLAAKAP